MRRLAWGERTYVMGVLNVTPDSFSGDGLAPAGRSEAEVVAASLDQARVFVAAGADILDVGAESSRPAAVYGEHPAVDLETELGLAIPVIEALTAALGDEAMISIDTTKAEVAQAALRAGAGMVNDVWAARRDPGTAEAAAAAGAYLVVMHNKDVAEYPDGVLPEVIGWLRSAAESAAEAGVARDRILVDPGIGFGKTPDAQPRGAPSAGGAEGRPRAAPAGRDQPQAVHRGDPGRGSSRPAPRGLDRERSAGRRRRGRRDPGPRRGLITRALRVADAIARRAAPTWRNPGSRAASRCWAPRRPAGMAWATKSGRASSHSRWMSSHPSMSAAVAGDDLEQTVNYAALQALVVNVVATTSFRLIETLAAATGEAVLGRWPGVSAVEVAVRKPEAPMPAPFERVEARIKLSRNH